MTRQSANRQVVPAGPVLGCVLWALAVIWLVPQLLSLAHRGALPFSDFLLPGRETAPLGGYLDRWRWFALWSTALGGPAAVFAIERRWLSIPAVSVAALIAATFLFHLATIRQGMWYGSDAALYLMHARNIVEGVPYAATGYLVNPTHFHSPPTYPPLFPLMLAPIYAIGGFNMYAMKVLIVGMTALTTLAVYGLSRRVLPVMPSLMAAWLFAFSPFVASFNDDVASDLPFLVAALLCLLLAEKAQEVEARADAGWKLGAVVGLLCYAAVATRTIGVVLLPAVLLADILRVRRLSRYITAFLVVSVTLICVQEVALGNVQAYADRDNRSDWGVMLDYGAYHARQFTRMLFGGLPNGVQVIAAIAAALAAVSGVLLAFYRRWSPTALFLGGYTVALALWPNTSGPRLLLPLLALGPIFVAAALWPAAGRHVWRKSIAAAFVALFAVSFAVRHHNASSSPLPESYDRPEHVELAAFVNRETSPSDVFVSIAPRTLALLTGRSSSIYDIHLSLEDQWEYFAAIRATYVVAYRWSAEADATYLTTLIRTYRDRLELAFSNDAYLVYRIGAETSP